MVTLSFYSDAVLGNLHRRTAVQEWAKLRNGEQVPLERALAAFDMFVLHERKGDFNEVCIDFWMLSSSRVADENRLRLLLTELQNKCGAKIQN